MSSCGKVDHCCWLGIHGVCQYLETDTVPGRKYACGLMRQLGDWELVHIDPRYLRDIKPKLDAMAITVENCGDWPPVGEECGACGDVRTIHGD
jgi:hypothetical protein